MDDVTTSRARRKKQPEPEEESIPTAIVLPEASPFAELAEAMNVGHDETTKETLRGLLDAGFRPCAIAKEAGVSEGALWAMIGRDVTLRRAADTGQDVARRRLRATVTGALENVVYAAEQIAVAGKNEQARVAAVDALRKIAVDTGAIGSGEDQKEVAIGFEGTGRLAILLGRRKSSDVS